MTIEKARKMFSLLALYFWKNNFQNAYECSPFSISLHMYSLEKFYTYYCDYY